MVVLKDKMNNKIVENEDIAYIADEKLIEDSLCPKCMQKISNDTEFCGCGFYVKAAKVSSVFSFVFFLIVSILVFGTLLYKSNFITNMEINVTKKIEEKGMSKTASPVVQVANVLSKSGLNYLIRDVYVQDYKHKNILVIVIKPEYWPTLKPKTKKHIHKKITELWKKAYTGEDPQVRYANPE